MGLKGQDCGCGLDSSDPGQSFYEHARKIRLLLNTKPVSTLGSDTNAESKKATLIFEINEFRTS
jgi:hypothetical protein